MNVVENTSKRPPELHLAGMMGGRSDGYIEGMEAVGVQQLKRSDVLPVKMKGASDEVLTALGFTLGPPVDGDPLFRHAILPYGWQRLVTDDSMWVKVVDQWRRVRLNLFYKASFYDRRASGTLATLKDYLCDVIEGRNAFYLDVAWATREAVFDAIAAMRAQLEDDLRDLEERRAELETRPGDAQEPSPDAPSRPRIPAYLTEQESRVRQKLSGLDAVTEHARDAAVRFP